MNKVVIRWFDGYIETFKDVEECRFGSDFIWIKLKNSKNRHIPTRQVRWYSVYPESHEE